MEKSIFFTSESVSEGHPDKVADIISDAIVDAYLRVDKNARIASETMVTTDTVILAGEISSKVSLSKEHIERLVRDTIRSIGYNRPELKFDSESCNIINLLHEQSSDIAQGVDKGDEKETGAGDQGIMFGYAINETENYMPLTLELSNKLLLELKRQRETRFFLRPDAKSQVTIQYDENWKPIKIDTILISTQHAEPTEIVNYFDLDTTRHCDIVANEFLYNFINDSVIRNVVNSLPKEQKKLFFDYKVLVNPTGKFVIGGPHGDCGLTGRKIVVDSYGGRCAVGGGAFSSKCPTKVDRSAAYMCRYIAKNLVASGVTDEAIIQISYAIGKKEPLSVYVNTNGKSKINIDDFELSKRIQELFDLTPYGIITKLKLKNPIYQITASYCHFGRESFVSDNLEYFTWEKLDSVDLFKKEFIYCK